ncbi:MAG: MptD family putative ECF transporter S component [Eggerthellaceae bacterium]
MVAFHDLHAEGLNPVIPQLSWSVAGRRSDGPAPTRDQDTDGTSSCINCGQPPAILKGWVDRVLREGVAYGFAEGDSGGGLPIGLLKARAVLVFNTSNTPEARELEAFGDPLQRLWRDCICDFCGVTTFDRVMFRVVADSTPADRRTWLEQARTMTREVPVRMEQLPDRTRTVCPAAYRLHISNPWLTSKETFMASSVASTASPAPSPSEGKVLKGRDLINIGIFTAIYFVIQFVFMLCGGIHPALWVFMPALDGLFAGIPFMLMCAKVQKPGAVVIMGLIGLNYRDGYARRSSWL